MAKCEVCKADCSGEIKVDDKAVCGPSHAQHILDLKEQHRQAELKQLEILADKKRLEDAAALEKKLGEENDAREKARLEAEKKSKKK